MYREDMFPKSSGYWEYRKLKKSEEKEEHLMKKKAIKSGLLGIPAGIAIGYVITILISLGWGDGYYYPCVPTLVDNVGSEIGAVVIQTILCALIGCVYGAASVIWDIEEWSLTKQTVICFLIYSLSMLPCAYAVEWMEHSVSGVLIYFGIFCAIFVMIWAAQYLGWKYRINKINRKIALDK